MGSIPGLLGQVRGTKEIQRGFVSKSWSVGRLSTSPFPSFYKSVKSYLLINLFPPSIIIENDDTARRQSVPKRSAAAISGAALFISVVHI